MSRISLSPNASGTGTLTIAAPNTNADRTLNLPDATTTLVGTDASQTLTNKTISGSTIQGGALTLGTAVASTSGTAIDFTGIPSWAKRVTVMLSGVSFAANPSFLFMRLGTSSGFDTTADYDTSASNLYGAAIATTSTIDTLFYLTSTASFAATTTFSGSIVLVKISGNRWLLSGSLVCLNAVNATVVSSGQKNLSSDLDRIRISSGNLANFDAGTVNIMWEG